MLMGNGVATAGGWQSPVRPMTVTRHFEQPATPYAAGHRGVDLAGEPGQAVTAAADGVVSYAGPLAGRGVVVVVHGTLRTTYEPVQPAVRRGAEVAAGALIGRLQSGHHGCPAAACLHWGLLRGETYLDPLSRLGAQQIRLFPPAVAGAVPVTGASDQVQAAKVGTAGALPPTVTPGVTWSVAALAGAGVIMVRRRR